MLFYLQNIPRDTVFFFISWGNLNFELNVCSVYRLLFLLEVEFFSDFADLKKSPRGFSGSQNLKFKFRVKFGWENIQIPTHSPIQETIFFFYD